MVKRKANKPKEEVSCLEESVLRMRHGLKENGEEKKASYERKPVSDEVYQSLLWMEFRALCATGRLQARLPDDESM